MDVVEYWEEKLRLQSLLPLAPLNSVLVGVMG